MKRIFYLMASCIFFVTGCAHTYHSPVDGPRASSMFTAPILSYNFGTTDLYLFISHADEDCKLIKLGRVDLSPGHKEEKFELEAGTRTYMEVKYFVNGFGFTTTADVTFSFIPELGAEYNIQYMELGNHMEVNLFKKSPEGEWVRIGMDKFSSCRVK